jgi:acetyl-CoA synthetase
VGHHAVVEAAAIGVPDELKGSEVVIFCVLAPGQRPAEDLRQELRESVARALGKPLAPRKVLFVNDLPKTRNAKVMRRMIRSAYLGQDPGDTSSLVNPEAVEEIRRAR